MEQRKKLKPTEIIRIVWNSAGIVFYFFYCGYLFISGRGNRVLNYCLLAFSIVYAILFVVVTVFAHGRRKILIGVTAKNIYKLFRRLMLLFGGVLLGGSIANYLVDRRRPIFMLAAMIVIIGWFVLKVLFRILYETVRNRFLTALHMVKKSVAHKPLDLARDAREQAATVDGEKDENTENASENEKATESLHESNP